MPGTVNHLFVCPSEAREVLVVAKVTKQNIWVSCCGLLDLKVCIILP